jgi:hypothetical protein
MLMYVYSERITLLTSGGLASLDSTTSTVCGTVLYIKSIESFLTHS